MQYTAKTKVPYFNFNSSSLSIHSVYKVPTFNHISLLGKNKRSNPSLKAAVVKTVLFGCCSGVATVLIRVLGIIGRKRETWAAPDVHSWAKGHDYKIVNIILACVVLMLPG